MVIAKIATGILEIVKATEREANGERMLRGGAEWREGQ